MPSANGMSGYYAQQNAGKRNVSIDLNAPGARDLALRLCDEADIVVENFRAGALASFGLDYEAVAARNPGKIGRASCRERVCPHVSISVDAVSLKTQRQQRPKHKTQPDHNTNKREHD